MGTQKAPVFKSAIYAFTLILAGIKCDGLKGANQSNTLRKADEEKISILCNSTCHVDHQKKVKVLASSVIWASIFNKTGIQKHGKKKVYQSRGKKKCCFLVGFF